MEQFALSRDHCQRTSSRKHFKPSRLLSKQEFASPLLKMNFDSVALADTGPTALKL